MPVGSSCKTREIRQYSTLSNGDNADLERSGLIAALQVGKSRFMNIKIVCQVETVICFKSSCRLGIGAKKHQAQQHTGFTWTVKCMKMKFAKAAPSKPSDV